MTYLWLLWWPIKEVHFLQRWWWRLRWKLRWKLTVASSRKSSSSSSWSSSLARPSPTFAIIIRACCHEAIFSKTLAWVFFWCLFMYKNSTKKLKNLGRCFHEWKLVWSFGPIYMVKRVKNSEKNAIFQNLLKTHPKMLNAWNKCLPTHFGGCFAKFLESVLILGRSKCHFLALETGTFGG